MSRDKFYIAGVDIGGTKIALCLTDSEGQILATERFPSEDYEVCLPKIVAGIKKMCASLQLEATQLAGCGISAPGPMDAAKGLLFKSPNMRWDNAPIRDDLQAALGVPAVLENDANAGVLAEWYFGSARGKQNVIYLTMSTGVGAGIISNGELVSGCNGNAGEIGHVCLDVNGPLCGCGQRGCLEAYCGGRSVALRLQGILRDWPSHALLRLPGVEGKLENVSFKTLLDGARAGIPLAVEMWEEYCLRLAQGIGTCIMAFNPELIVLGTVAYHAGDFMLDRVKAQLPRFAWSFVRECCEIRTSALGLKIGELAGASVGMSAARQAGWKI